MSFPGVLIYYEMPIWRALVLHPTRGGTGMIQRITYVNAKNGTQRQRCLDGRLPIVK